MNTGRLVFAGLLALVLAIGASSTAHAGSSYGFSFSTGGPAWIAPVYPAPAAYIVPVAPPPPPPVIYPYPYLAPAPVGPSISFGFVSH